LLTTFDFLLLNGLFFGNLLCFDALFFKQLLIGFFNLQKLLLLSNKQLTAFNTFCFRLLFSFAPALSNNFI